MKAKLLLQIIVLSIITVVTAGAKGDPAFKVSGRVVDGKSLPVGYATVVLENGGSYGTVADSLGMFSVSVNGGVYEMSVQCLGYKTILNNISVEADTDFGDILLEEDAVAVDNVVVRGQAVRREADRFVVNVAAMASSVGKTAFDVLSTSPAVWLTETKLSVNGKEGVRVMINERLLTMSIDDLVIYLKNINAEDISKIEIIPTSGAEYDADSHGGIIKITLRKQRLNGLEGSVGISYAFNEHGYYNYSPSANLNFRHNSLSFYVNGNYRQRNPLVHLTETTDYVQTGVISHSDAKEYDLSKYWGVRPGMVYDISDDHSIGGEFSMSNYSSNEKMSSLTDLRYPDKLRRDSAGYFTDDRTKFYSGTVNYIWKIDTLGSTFKVIGDYYARRNTPYRTYDTYYTDYDLPGYGITGSGDSLYRNDTRNNYDVFSVTADLDMKFKQGMVFKAGVKFISNKMDDNSLYEGLTGGQWAVNRDYSLSQEFREKIGAVYGIFNYKLGKLSYSMGIRGEYTSSEPSTTPYGETKAVKAKRTYFDLFPNIHLSHPINEEKGHSITASYNRKISRPGFWALNPARMKISEYSYITGDPKLKPHISDNISLTFVAAHKYTITGGVDFSKNSIAQVLSLSDEDPNIVVYKQSNISGNKNVFVSTNLPWNVTDKLDISLNFYYTHLWQRLRDGDPFEQYDQFYTNASVNYAFPAGFHAELSGYYVSDQQWGNMHARSEYNINFGLKKKFFGDRLTTSLDIRNVLANTSKTRINVSEAGMEKHVTQKDVWSSRHFSISLRYNFKTGIKVKSKNVERSGDDSRMGGGM